jgi:hypothetical protein
VTNPFLDKTTEDFESELHEAFTVVRRALTDEGVLAFTYHHSDSESWGELLESLCDVGFEVTATYPISADVKKFITGDAVSLDIVVVARPIAPDEREPIRWQELRRRIHATATDARRELAAERDLSAGDVGVVEMGACFREYSNHHGEVRRGEEGQRDGEGHDDSEDHGDGEVMGAKEIVEEIYGIVQETTDAGVVDVFVDLLGVTNPTADDVRKRCRGTNADPEELAEMGLVSTDDDGFSLGTWDHEERQAYLRERIDGERNGDGDKGGGGCDDDGGLTTLDKLQFLRQRYETGRTIQQYLDRWEGDDDLRDLAALLADATGDETYRRLLGNRDVSSFG